MRLDLFYTLSVYSFQTHTSLASLLMRLIILVVRGGVGLKMFNLKVFSAIFTLSLLFFWVCFGEFTQI